MPPGPSFGKPPSPWRFRTASSSGSNAKEKNPPHGGRMVQLRHRQQNLGEVFFAREAESLMEAWMKEVDEILEDEPLLDLVYEQLGRRYPQSRKRGRNSTPADVVLRLIGYRVMEIARLSRSKGQEEKEKMREKYRELVRLTRQVRNQAQRFSEEIHRGVKRAVNRKQQAVLRGMKQELDAMIPLVNQVLRQTTARVFRGVTDTPGKIVSVFEPKAEIIRKGKVNKPTEFGKLVKIQEAENQIITHYAVCRQRPADSTLLLAAVHLHQQRLGRAPELLAGDAGDRKSVV